MSKKLFLTCIHAAILFAILVGSAQADLNLANGSASGQWYNPARDGEGFYIEIIQGNPKQIGVAMYSYDAQGNQLWLVGNIAIAEGDIGATIPVFLIDGPVWGTAYNPADKNTTQFGNISVRFPTCDSALFSVQSNVAGLESGNYSLVRITEIVGMECVEPPPPDTPEPPPAGGITSGMWTGQLGESVVCFFVNEEGTRIIETDECDQGKAFSAEIDGIEIDIDGKQNPDTCVSSVVCGAAWDIVTINEGGVEYQQVICANEVGGIGQVIFDTSNRGRARAYEGVDPDQASGRMCYGPDIDVTPVQ